jgi:hypothetical protein
LVTSMADVAGFDSEFSKRLRLDRLVFLSELYELGKRFGLSREQVDRVVGQAEVSGKGFTDVVVVYGEDVHG